ncbi:hypothetical protein AB1Y20_002152 [Prymnesium parvum]|uniref:non-specific serine/threonine protein kinase n=1 Tax=Prymnesium parvum TaxID=97485 RepID=A0AB34J9J8_PRYPA
MSHLSGFSSLLEKGKVLLDKGKELGAELGRGLASGHKPQLVEIEGRQLVLTSLIAEGGYAFVHLARDASSGERFAVKRALAQDKDSASVADAELQLLRTLPPHPNIIRLFGASRRKADGGRGVEYLYVLELCSKGSLAKHVTPRATGGMPPRLRESRVLQYFVDTCKGVAHMHAQTPPIQHRDLKLENVLCTDRHVCKLCDFGSVTTRTIDCATATRKERLDEEDLISRYTTAWNRAPEMIDLHRGHRIDEKVDVWALGCLLYTLAFQRHPFDTESPLQILNSRWDFPPNSAYSPELHGLVIACLTPDPARRPSVFEITERAAVTLGEKMAEELTCTEEAPGAFGEGAYGRVGEAGGVDMPEEPRRASCERPLPTSAPAFAPAFTPPPDDWAAAFDRAGPPAAASDRQGRAATQGRQGEEEAGGGGSFWANFDDASEGGGAAAAGGGSFWHGGGGGRGGDLQAEGERPAPPSPQLQPSNGGEMPGGLDDLMGGTASSGGQGAASLDDQVGGAMCSGGQWAGSLLDLMGGASSSEGQGAGSLDDLMGGAPSSGGQGTGSLDDLMGGAPSSGGQGTGSLDDLMGGAPSSGHSGGVAPSKSAGLAPPEPPLPPTVAPRQDAKNAGFDIGERVRVCDLQSKPELNGQIGTVLGWDGAKGRYNVNITSGGVLALKPTNLRRPDLPPSSHSPPAYTPTAPAQSRAPQATTSASSSSFTSASPPPLRAPQATMSASSSSFTSASAPSRAPQAASSASSSSLDMFDAFAAFSTSVPPAAAPPLAEAQRAPAPSCGATGTSATSSPIAAGSAEPLAKSLKEHLRSLRECLDEGLITQDDFEREKAALLQSSRP